jgi:DnaK suppressor protein
MRVSVLNLIKDSLLHQKSEILNKSCEFRSTQATEKERCSDEAETASCDLTTQVSINLHERERSQLVMIERSLARISEGTYGVCEACNDDIGESRLKARPFASMCIDCMEEKEENGRLLN